MSLKSKDGFLVILCCAHLAGAISRKNGGRNGLVYLSRLRLIPNITFFNFESEIPYISLNSLDGKEINIQEISSNDKIAVVSLLISAI